MSRESRLAVKCFDENRTLFANPQSEPEKWNLYTGLAALAEAVAQLQMQVDYLSRELSILRSQLHR